jgi:hypothetical protein
MDVLPPRWILHSIQINELDGYTALVVRRGSGQPRELGRVYGSGETIAAALDDTAARLAEVVIQYSEL